MVLNQYIQNLIRNKTGNHLTLSIQFELLSKDIFDVTGNVLSVNTLKRLFGRLADVSTSHTTLNIIAEYLGFENWEKLESVAENGNSCLCSLKDTVFPKDLDTGTRLENCYWKSQTTNIAGLSHQLAGNYARAISFTSQKSLPDIH